MPGAVNDEDHSGGVGLGRVGGWHVAVVALHAFGRAVHVALHLVGDERAVGEVGDGVHGLVRSEGQADDRRVRLADLDGGGDLAGSGDGGKESQQG